MEMDISKYLLTQGPFAALFVWLLISTRKDNKERERQLYNTIDRQNEALTKFGDKYDVVIDKLDKIEGRLK
ncbi:MAG: hypothetical protein LPK00_01195 [Bacillaceae bacterium]|nr:hypothetical protein [Bacillaceae bacterium]